MDFSEYELSLLGIRQPPKKWTEQDFETYFESVIQRAVLPLKYAFRYAVYELDTDEFCLTVFVLSSFDVLPDKIEVSRLEVGMFDAVYLEVKEGQNRLILEKNKQR